MTQVTNTEEMTELNKTIQEARQEAATDGKPPKRLNLSDKQKGAIALGTVMLGGAAFVAMSQNSDGSVATPVTASPTTPADSTAVAPKPELAHGTTQPVTGGTICPTEDVAIAHNVNNDMTFDQAFETARDEVGPGGMFSWNDEAYNTFYKEEWSALSLDQKQEYLASVGYETTSSEEQIAENNEATPTGDVAVQNVDNEQDEALTAQPTDDDKPAATTKPEVKETMIDGKTAYAIDNDGDGVVDALVFLDPASNNPMALIDTTGDNALDTVAVLDPTTLEPIESAAMEQTFEIAMDDVTAINQESPAIVHDDPAAHDDENDDDNDHDITDNHDYSHDDNVDDIV